MNADYEGEILVMMSASGIIHIKAGEKMTQLLLLPYKQIGHTAPVKRTGGFGSTGKKGFLAYSLRRPKTSTYSNVPRGNKNYQPGGFWG